VTRSIGRQHAPVAHPPWYVLGCGHLHCPTLPLPVRAQLRHSSSGTWWEATYNTALKNTATDFKAKSSPSGAFVEQRRWA